MLVRIQYLTLLLSANFIRNFENANNFGGRRRTQDYT